MAPTTRGGKPDDAGDEGEVDPSYGVPRVGGASNGEAWTGGSNLKPRSRPKTAYARRPDDFKGASTIESECAKGLAESRRLGANECEKDSAISLTSWIQLIRGKI